MCENGNFYVPICRRVLLHQEDLWCYDFIYFRCVVYNVLVRLQFKWIAAIFPQTSQMTSGELSFSFFANNLYAELGIDEIRVVLCSIMRKLTPCCRNEDIFALTLFESIFSRRFPVRVFL